MEHNKEFYLQLLVKNFDLTDETIESLGGKLEFTPLTKKRVLLRKTMTAFTSLQNIISMGIHHGIVSALTEYADEDALKKYMENEGNKYKPCNDISSINASTFIIYSNDNKKETHNYIEKHYPSRYDMWEFEKINDEFSIAYD